MDTSVNFRVPPSPEEAKQFALQMKADFAAAIDETLKLDQTQVDQNPKAGDVFVEVKDENLTERVTLKNGKVRCEGVEEFADTLITGKEDAPEGVSTFSSERGHCGEGGKKPVEIYKLDEQEGDTLQSIEAGIKADGSGHVKFTETKTDGTIIDGFNVAFPA